MEITLSPYGDSGNAILNTLKYEFTADLLASNQPTKKIVASSYLYFYDVSEKPRAHVKYKSPQKNESDQKMIDKTPYNSLFWQNNPVVKRTTDENNTIKEFEKSNSFGKILEE
jgi:hypothetical protein